VEIARFAEDPCSRGAGAVLLALVRDPSRFVAFIHVDLPRPAMERLRRAPSSRERGGLTCHSPAAAGPPCPEPCRRLAMV